MVDYYTYKSYVNEYDHLTVRPVFSFIGKTWRRRGGVSYRGNLKPSEWRNQVNVVLQLYEYLITNGGLNASVVPRIRMSRLRQLYKRAGNRAVIYGREQEMTEIVAVGLFADCDRRTTTSASRARCATC